MSTAYLAGRCGRPDVPSRKPPLAWAARAGLAAWLLAAGGSQVAAEAPQVLAWISADADGDGKPDTLTLRGDATLLLEWAGRPPTVLRLGPQTVLSRPADLQFQATASGRYIVARASEVGRGGARQGRGMAVLLRGAQPTIVYQGPVGPVGRDGEYSQELGLAPAGLLRYQTNPAVRRCDGESRLFVERYSDPTGFAPSPDSTLTR